MLSYQFQNNKLHIYYKNSIFGFEFVCPEIIGKTEVPES